MFSKCFNSFTSLYKEYRIEKIWKSTLYSDTCINTGVRVLIYIISLMLFKKNH